MKQHVQRHNMTLCLIADIGFPIPIEDSNKAQDNARPDTYKTLSLAVIDRAAPSRFESSVVTSRMVFFASRILVQKAVTEDGVMIQLVGSSSRKRR
ncbi:hypothetical protein ACOSQ3_024449 [Xanthoceras sorbifolium]